MNVADTGIPLPVLTVGHSTRTLEELIHLLQVHHVRTLVDVRTIARSRRNPQFNQETLPKDLEKSGIKYVWLKGLGGLRRPQQDSLNTGWRNASFRGFADYMQTPEFESSLRELIELAKNGTIAIMCAEAVPWRCHRSLISDTLLVKGVQVEHIMNPKTLAKHAITKWARVEDQRITYPPTVKP